MIAFIFEFDSSREFNSIGSSVYLSNVIAFTSLILASVYLPIPANAKIS